MVTLTSSKAVTGYILINLQLFKLNTQAHLSVIFKGFIELYIQ